MAALQSQQEAVGLKKKNLSNVLAKSRCRDAEESQSNIQPRSSMARLRRTLSGLEEPVANSGALHLASLHFVYPVIYLFYTYMLSMLKLFLSKHKNSKIQIFLHCHSKAVFPLK